MARKPRAAKPAAQASAKKPGDIYVFSTLANDQLYTDYAKGPADMPVERRSVLIKGGSGIANDRLITPQGVMTRVTEEELAVLEKDHHFNLHRDRGFIVVRRSDADPDKVATDMDDGDESKPYTPADYMSGDQKEPTVGAPA